MIITVRSFIFGIPIAGIFSASYGLTPTFFVARKYLPPHLYSTFFCKAVIFLTAQILTISTGAEISRMLPLFFLCYGLVFQALRNFVSFLNTVYQLNFFPSKFALISESYSQLQILINVRFAISRSHDYFLYAVGIWLSVLANYSTLVAYPIIPGDMYPVFPAAAVLILMIIQVLLQAVVQVEVGIEDFLKKLKDSVPPRERLMKRKVAALHPLRLRIGINNFNLVQVGRNTAREYYEIIWNMTVNAVLAFPI
ncbi:hypothetical protein Fcan01_25425 [Folsomia candida]|uniref:Uncharacterized protein n=1 Tax=Folsomia candida TaxID=158441 RepID=A0A226D443_FOLCA|nr:hypothetical protein Fcan01_25425 [Folsomia candida]